MFNGFYITEKGREYIARSLVDRSLVFTRGEFGNGVLADGESPQTATNLKSSLGNLPISKKTTNLSTTTITTQFSNQIDGSLLPAFHLTEAGLYGKLVDSTGKDDPDNPESLLVYTIVPVEQSDYIKQILTEFIINWPIAISNAAAITVKIDGSLVYPTLVDYNKKMATINERLNNTASSFVAEDVSLTKDMFSEDSTYKVYPFKATIPLLGVTDQAIADVVFGPDEAESGIFGSITETQEGEVVLYARELPEDEEIIIPTIEIRYPTGAKVPDDNSGNEDITGDDILGSDDIATDGEVGDVIEDIFGTDDGGTGDDSGGDTGGEGGDESSGDDTSGDIATDEEVGDVIDDVFGTDDTTGEEPTEDNVATDEEVQDAIDDIFG